jgi:hypothetical protein
LRDRAASSDGRCGAACALAGSKTNHSHATVSSIATCARVRRQLRGSLTAPERWAAAVMCKREVGCSGCVVVLPLVACLSPSRGTLQRIYNLREDATSGPDVRR